MYQALYRKYRPRTFSDVLSQDLITGTLRNQIRTGNLGHSFLFTGSRGTGKTTCARIFAKALVCENPKDGEPCLECSMCRGFDDESLTDVVEMDAASNNGVDDARDLIEHISFYPEKARYRVFIIDEVHMLTASAFNALLKTIEEPPDYLKFIFATTEVHKLLPTIVSRCQRFDFRRVQRDDLVRRIEYVVEKEGLSIERDAALEIAVAADGGMRDALSMLDRCVAFGSENSVITSQIVENLVGISGKRYIFDLLRLMYSKDAVGTLALFGELYQNSKDLSQLCRELLTQLRNIMVVQISPESSELLGCMPEDENIIREIAETRDYSFTRYMITAMSELSARLRSSVSKRSDFEITLVDICISGGTEKTAQTSDSRTAELLEKIAMLSNELDELRANGVPSYQTAQVGGMRRSEPTLASRESVTDTSGMNQNESTLFDKWNEVLERFTEKCPSVSGTLTGSEAYVSGDIILIVTDNNFFMELLRVKENSLKLIECIRTVTGRNYKIRAKCTAEKVSKPENKLSSIIEKAEKENIPVSTE